MPNFFIREKKVVRFIPRRAAAPSGPPTRPLHAVTARMISLRCLLSYSSRRLVVSLAEFVLSPTTCSRLRSSARGTSIVFVFRSSPRGASSDLLRVTITAPSPRDRPNRQQIHCFGPVACCLSQSQFCASPFSL